MSTGTPPPGWLRRWEELHVVVQIAVVAPISVALLWAVHVYLLNQPAGRGLGYALFWSVLVVGALVGATRSERARRATRL